MKLSSNTGKLLALGLLLWPAALSPAQTFKPFTSLREVETTHFTIIFPEESRKTAAELASFADDCYDEVSGRLGIELRDKLPVTITPHTDEFNGYYSPLPYPHIVLFDTPMSIEWTSFRESFRSLFLHELTHAVSLNSRGPATDLLYRIFGGWVIPAALNTPYFMTEGITVSFESLEGHGRANDPRIRERLRQALLEGEFLDPFQSSGIYDLPTGSPPYEYGGLFSAWLQKRFGMEKYGELWKRMGSELHVSFSFYKTGFFAIAQEVYGVPIQTLWAEFADSLRLEGVGKNETPTLLSGELKLKALATDGKLLYCLDTISGTVRTVEPSTGKVATVLTADSTAYDIDVSPDGNRILVSGYRYRGALATAWVREYSARTGCSTGRAWKGLYHGRYFRDGIVAIASDNHATDLVYEREDGTRTILLEGTDSLLFSAPAPLDDHRIACIAAIEGDRKILLLDTASGSVSILKTDLPDDTGRWKYARGLCASGGKLFFSYNHDDRFYKLAAVSLPEAGAMSARFSTKDFSGGVFNPVAIGNGIYYAAAFTRFDSLQKFPEPATSFDAVETAVRLESLPALSHPEGRETASADLPGEKTHWGVSYLNPFKLWIPFPLTATDGKRTEFQGGGIYSYMGTPSDNNTLFLSIFGDAEHKMAQGSISWTSLSLSLPLTFAASDKIEYGSSLEDATRAVRTSLAVSWLRGIGGERFQLGITPSISAVFLADDPGNGTAAYLWNFSPPEYTAAGTVSLSSFHRNAWKIFPAGASLEGTFKRAFPSQSVEGEGSARCALSILLPLRASAYGAWSPDGLEIDGSSDLFGEAGFADVALGEYTGEVPGEIDYIAGGEIECQLFNLEAETHFSHLYFNRFFSTLAYRGAFYPREGSETSMGELNSDWGYLQSAVLKLGGVISALPLQSVPYSLSPWISCILKLSSLPDGDSGNDVTMGLGLSVFW